MNSIEGLTQQIQELTELAAAQVRTIEALVPSSKFASEELIGAVARGWCSEANEGKTMDTDLAFDIANSVHRYLQSLAAPQPAAAPVAAAVQGEGEWKRQQLENRDFHEWWESSGQKADHDLRTENAAHAAWQERGQRAASLEVKPEHVAYAENGVLYWMSGRKFQNCELYTAPPPQQDSERDVVLGVAYGILWHVNAGMDAPPDCEVLSVTPERAAYEARKALRDMLTKEQRGHGINAAHKRLAAMAAHQGDQTKEPDKP